MNISIYYKKKVYNCNCIYYTYLEYRAQLYYKQYHLYVLWIFTGRVSLGSVSDSMVI